MFDCIDHPAKTGSLLKGGLLAAVIVVSSVFGNLVFSEVSAAVPSDAAAGIQSRKDHFKELEDALRAIRRELGKPNPDLTTMRDRSKRVGALASQLPTWFPVGTGPESGFDTEAEASIWQQPAEFHRVAQVLADQAALLDAASAQGDVPAIRQKLHDVGGSCQSCHDRFRNDSWW